MIITTLLSRVPFLPKIRKNKDEWKKYNLVILNILRSLFRKNLTSDQSTIIEKLMTNSILLESVDTI